MSLIRWADPCRNTCCTPCLFILSSGWKICILTHLKEYIQRTSHLRNDIKQLILSHSMPHGPVSKDTISRWCKAIANAGVNVSKYSKATAPEQRQLHFLLLTIAASKTLWCLPDGPTNGLFSNITTNQPSQSSTLAKLFWSRLPQNNFITSVFSLWTWVISLQIFSLVIMNLTYVEDDPLMIVKYRFC